MQLPAAPAPASGVPLVPVPGVPPVPQQPVYDAEDVTADPFAAPAPAPSPAASPFGGPAPPTANDPFAQGGGNAYGLNADPFAAAPASAPTPAPNYGGGGGDMQRRPCPSCGEMIPTGAATCRFCGEIFDTRMHQHASRSRGYNSDDNLEAVDWFLAICCFNLGCIVGLVYLIQGKKKGLKMIGINILVQFALGFIYGLLTAM